MKQKETLKLLQDFVDQCERDIDGYMILHFSEEDKKFIIHGKNVDKNKALFAIKQIAVNYKITPIEVLQMTEKKKGGLITPLRGLTKPDGKTPLN